jgi:hypothetical protein
MLLGRIVDEDVEAAKLAYGILHELLAKGLVTNISWKWRRFTPFGLNELHNFSGIWFFDRQITEGDICTLAGKGNDRRTSDSRSPPVTRALRPVSRPEPL